MNQRPHPTDRQLQQPEQGNGAKKQESQDLFQKFHEHGLIDEHQLKEVRDQIKLTKELQEKKNATEKKERELRDELEKERQKLLRIKH